MTREGEAPVGGASHLCPLCGQANHCAMAAGGGTECWCVGASFSQDVLMFAARRAGTARCICARCAGDAMRSSAATAPDAR